VLAVFLDAVPGVSADVRRDRHHPTTRSDHLLRDDPGRLPLPSSRRSRWPLPL